MERCLDCLSRAALDFSHSQCFPSKFEGFNPLTNEWESLPPMKTPRYYVRISILSKSIRPSIDAIFESQGCDGGIEQSNLCALVSQ